jgi:hypothetical protein
MDVVQTFMYMLFPKALDVIEDIKRRQKTSRCQVYELLYRKRIPKVVPLFPC